MADLPKLHRFLRGEFEAEAKSGFARLKRVPDTHVRHFVDYYLSLRPSEQEALAEAATLWGTMGVAGRAGLPYRQILASNEAWSKWRNERMLGQSQKREYWASVPLLRAVVVQAKIDRAKGRVPKLADGIEEYASSVRSVKAPELRKKVRTVLLFHLGAKPEKQGGGEWDYHGLLNGATVGVEIDYGGRHAQLCYRATITAPALSLTLRRICYESCLGAGFGDWNFIVEENLDDSITLLGEFIEYLSNLPDRLPEGCLTNSEL